MSSIPRRLHIHAYHQVEQRAWAPLNLNSTYAGLVNSGEARKKVLLPEPFAANQSNAFAVLDTQVNFTESTNAWDGTLPEADASCAATHAQ
jgi:hypothetical protein